MNTQITEDYVSFEIAKLLKEKWFNEECFALYNSNKELIQCGVRLNNTQVGRVEGSCSAPTLQMAMKWLRYEKNIHIKVHCSGNRNYLVYAQSLVTAFPDFCIESATCSFNTYEEACEAAINYCLTNLI